ncbi:BRCA1-associated RING domain protein 1 [Striga hermonthica]|uniref:BRCA1-associated RING domain protein 1 n=1 Tax=Striga hermonthica TaxID=68872 RepID=A0A9N7NNT8_STRHE|nr:BRCA1-associated RING domain protein 1 [Striga hermonthica]
MSEAARMLNPWCFHFQKLGLELKCPVCLNLLYKPVLLPCNHIFCNSCVPAISQFTNQCPACQQQFTNQDIRPASHLENIVSIYKNLDSTFNSSVLPLLSNASKEEGNHTGALIINRISGGLELTKCSVSEETDLNHAPDMSPSSCEDVKQAGHKNEAGSTTGGTPIHPVKKPASEMGDKDASHTRELKRQKKLDYELADAALHKHGQSQQITSHTDQASVSNYNEECKSKEVTCDVSDLNGSVCAFCHSSTITEATGPMLYYADGKEVAREAAFPNAIPVHNKCILWTPKVYYEGEKIKNLESELLRASKLKCSSCGSKGAALGCYAKSCRKTYHVPCAVEVPNCKWDCDDYLMLCPLHKSVKFPNEKSSKSRKHHSEQKPSLPMQIASEQSNFWSNHPTGPQEWVLCGSSLSSDDKCLLVEFASICGATVFKFWNPNVTHVIAATDENGACSRTLKVLMGILNGRWILTIDWIKACMEANAYVGEEPYEVSLDNHGCRGGPKSGRLRALNNAPKLFDKFNFYFCGEFVPSYKSDLLELVRVGGGTIITSLEGMVEQNKHDQQAAATTFVVYNNDYPQGFISKDGDIDARVIPHIWILESIAACRVLSVPLC